MAQTTRTGPTAAQARRQRARQAAIAAHGAKEVGGLIARAQPWRLILSRWVSFQMQSATSSVQSMAAWSDAPPQTRPEMFAGVSSQGRSLAEPMVSLIDKRIPAPVEELPAPWWDDADAFLREAERLIAAEIQEAGAGAAQVELIGQGWPGYVRLLQAPSCKRCVVLAGKFFRYNAGFERHPECDCIHGPSNDWEWGEKRGLVAAPEDVFKAGGIRNLTQAERRAIEDGADIVEVINASAAIYTDDSYGPGRKYKATSYGTTKRSAWRKKNLSRRVRVRPESIYKWADDEGWPREQLLKTLRLYGYLT